MSTIIPGFEYDIFISYRQKDNKHDGWVTEFVNHLKGELEATFKEEISVYFDINPTDGLLETHDVDASLKEKLNCLIFIPVISRTYCDPRSFAWEHEFKVFVEQASRDQFGLKVRLPNGNVASRVLPVRIHDIDDEDKTLIERELNGPLRAIDFIYKEQGVNQPLTPFDDEKKNLNHTRYRNQINKVANATEELIHSLKKAQVTPSKKREQPIVTKDNMVDEIQSPKRKTRYNKKLKIGLIASLILILCISGIALFRILGVDKRANDMVKLEKSIAVLPFINDSPDKENQYFCNGMMDEILNKLQRIKDFRVVSRTSTTQYNKPDLPTIPEIAKKLGVNYIIEGSVQKYGNALHLVVQLIGAKGKEKHLWAHSYDLEIKDATELFQIQSSIAQSIAEELKAVITPEEKQIMDRVPTNSIKAYDYYLRGKEEIWKYGMGGGSLEATMKAESFFRKSLQQDSTFAKGWAGLAEVCWRKAHVFEDLWLPYHDSMLMLANKALSYDDKTEEAYIERAGYYAEILKDVDKAIEELDKTVKFNPNYWQVYWEKAKYYYWNKMDLPNAVENLYHASLLNHGAQLPEILISLGDAFVQAGFPEKGDSCYREALSLDGDSTRFISSLAWKALIQGENEKSKELCDKICRKDAGYVNEISFFDLNLNYASVYINKHQPEKALQYIHKLKYSEKTNQQLKYLSWPQIVFIYWMYTYWKMQDFSLKKRFELNLKLINSLDSLSTISQDYYSFCLYSIKGEKEKALKFLNKFNEENREYPLCAVTIFKNDPSLDNIRNEPEFRKIMRDVESKYQVQHEKVGKWLEKQEKSP